jgi:hypothetical protein
MLKHRHKCCNTGDDGEDGQGLPRDDGNRMLMEQSNAGTQCWNTNDTDAGTRMLEHRCWNTNDTDAEHECWNTDAGTRMTQMLEHECWNTGAGTRMLEHRCWNTNDTDAGTQRCMMWHA